MSWKNLCTQHFLRAEYQWRTATHRQPIKASFHSLTFALTAAQTPRLTGVRDHKNPHLTAAIYTSTYEVYECIYCRTCEKHVIHFEAVPPFHSGSERNKTCRTDSLFLQQRVIWACRWRFSVMPDEMKCWLNPVLKTIRPHICNKRVVGCSTCSSHEVNVTNNPLRVLLGVIIHSCPPVLSCILTIRSSWFLQSLFCGKFPQTAFPKLW